MLIDTQDCLIAACDKWAAAPWLALDTEFVREQTYYAQLCLIQVSDGAQAAVVDTLHVGDLSPLLDLLYRDDTTKVFHSGSQDLEIFAQLRGSVPQPLFDSQIAAALLGEGDQLGYAALVERRLGVRLDKSLTRTDWSRRPLRPAELEYAADDVRHLAVLYPMLRDELNTRGRLGWLEQECTRIADPALYRTRPEDAWRRLRSLQRLPGKAQPLAAALAAWREREAVARNRPRKWILADDAVYRLAERRPDDLAALKALDVLPPKSLAQHGETLLEVLLQAEATNAPPIEIPPPLDNQQKALVTRLRQGLDDRAKALEIPASMLATRSDLESWVRKGEDADIALQSGWRREVAAELLESA